MILCLLLNIMPMYFRAVTSALQDSNWATADSISRVY